ncbi:MAG: hypothetical protein GY757_53330 [bacterium]|nr:hypothetical protein [bacterium]
MTNDLKILKLIELIIGKSLTKLDPLEIIGTLSGYVIDANGNITGLNLHALKISDISIIKKLKNLTHLDLSANQISDISSLKELQYLTYLDINSNHIADISTLKSSNALTFLNLSTNDIADISVIKWLRVLNFLDLNTNKVADISAVKGLTTLKELYLHSNKIADISAVENLTGLNTLTLWRNKITDISPIKGLVASANIEINDNKIGDISALNDITGIKRLDLRFNRITTLPEKITGIGVDIKWAYERENGLYLSGNPLEMPPVEIVKQGTAAIGNYIAELKSQESTRLLESKLIIVGNSEVGKTSLVRKLQDFNFQVEVGQEPTTHGINIAPWELNCFFDSNDTEKVRIHMWDFGGQDIYHATHQFFFTKRSLYLLVWEPRRETETINLGYWLSIISLLSNRSPVIIIMNKSDLYSKQIDEAAYKDKFKNIVGFLKESCLTGEGIPELRKKIQISMGRMPHLRDRIPKVWLDIRDCLNEQQKDYIHADEYYGICKSFGLDEQRARFLSSYLHDLGIILHYRNDPQLEHIVILNPVWATEAIYSLIDSPDIRGNQGGLFMFDHLKTIWDPITYPHEKHDELIRLMEKFELCFNVAGSRIYIIPEQLPAQRAGINFEGYRAWNNLLFEFHYNFMPDGIISRFIARCYYLVRQQNFWKSGVELAFENSTALVMSDVLNRKMIVSISGHFKKELLGIIRFEMKAIHRSLNLKKDKDFYEMLPCNCASCSDTENPQTFQYDVIENFRKKRFPLFCPKGYASVSIDKLIKEYSVERPGENLVKIISVIASHLLGVAGKISCDEESLNRFVSMLLSIKGFSVKTKKRGMTHRLEIRNDSPEGISVSVCDTFRLNNFDAAVIDSNMKNLFDSTPPGLKKNLILIYTDTDELNALWSQYLQYIPSIGFQYPMEGSIREGTDSGYSMIKVALTRHRKKNQLHNIYHMLINLKPQ